MIFVLAPSTLRRPDALQILRVPRQVLGRGFGFVPKRGMRDPVFWRLVLEQSLTRYVIALAPFPLAMLVWPELALPISQAPILMFGLVLFIETSVLSVSTPDKRRALIAADAAARGLDVLRARARTVLTRIAARRGLQTGTLSLVIEQSAMARVAPFTVVSLQYEDGGPVLLDPDAEEARMLREEVFGEGLDPRLLQRINLSENVFLRALPLEVRSISAHARLQGLAERQRISARG